MLPKQVCLSQKGAICYALMGNFEVHNLNSILTISDEFSDYVGYHCLGCCISNTTGMPTSTWSTLVVYWLIFDKETPTWIPGAKYF